MSGVEGESNSRAMPGIAVNQLLREQRRIASVAALPCNATLWDPVSTATYRANGIMMVSGRVNLLMSTDMRAMLPSIRIIDWFIMPID